MADSTAWSATPFVPDSRRLSVLAEAARSCTGCPLFRDTVQTVFGEGSPKAALVLVGEQPGDQEDRQGRPFVGPAGRVLWRCLDEAGIDPKRVYLTNAVKHFKHEDRGKRRLHKRPTAAEADACHPWLEAELEAVQANVVVALGAVAARAVTGKTTAVAASRGRPFDIGDRKVFITYHPSAVLRRKEDAAEIRSMLAADLRTAHTAAEKWVKRASEG
jgi:uracil-DNA glycosylase family protein